MKRTHSNARARAPAHTHTHTHTSAACATCCRVWGKGGGGGASVDGVGRDKEIRDKILEWEESDREEGRAAGGKGGR